MGKRTKIQQHDRVTHARTGEVGTVADVYDGPKGGLPNYAVVMDTGSMRPQLWKGEDVAEWEPGDPRKCIRCGVNGHPTVFCHYGDAGSSLSPEAREALVSLGLDPRRAPGDFDSKDAYDGLRLWKQNRRDIYKPMRRRVCALGKVLIDGHRNGSTCATCEGAT